MRQIAGLKMRLLPPVYRERVSILIPFHLAGESWTAMEEKHR
jgi:hypothetical protein